MLAKVKACLDMDMDMDLDTSMAKAYCISFVFACIFVFWDD